MALAIEFYWLERGRKFVPTLDGQDATLFYNGDYYGQNISDITFSREGRKYLKWIQLNDGFPARLRRIIKAQLEIYHSLNARPPGHGY